jgi:hypothetical protein
MNSQKGIGILKTNERKIVSFHLIKNLKILILFRSFDLAVFYETKIIKSNCSFPTARVRFILRSAFRILLLCMCV